MMLSSTFVGRGASRSRLVQSACVAALLVAGSASSALAQTAPQPALQGPGVSSVDDVVVTARRREETLKDVPISISVQTGAALERANITNIRDLTQLTPGLRLDQQGNVTQPSIRGVTTETTQIGNDPNIAIYLDGVYQQAATANAFELGDIQRVEVLKGPQGTLFGRNATGGAIRVVTQDPGFEPEGRFAANYGSFNDIKLTAFGSAPLFQDKLAASVSLYYHHSDGFYTDDATGDDAGGLDAAFIRAKLLWQINDHAKYVITGFYADSNDQSVYTLQPLNGNTIAARLSPGIYIPTQPYHRISNFSNKHNSESKSITGYGEWEFPFGTIASTTAYQSFPHHALLDADGTTFASQQYDTVKPNSSFSQEFTFASAPLFGDRFSYVAGVYYFDAVEENDPQLISNVIQINARVGTVASAVFGEGDFKLTDRLTLTAGLRYSSETKDAQAVRGVIPLPANTPLTDLGETTWTAWTPRVSLKYEVNDNFNAYFTYSEGFKAGGYNSSAITPIPVEPEEIKAYELGVKWSYSNGLFFNAAAFHYDYTNLQVQAITGSITVLTNAAEVTIDGLDIEFGARLTDNLRIRAAAEYLDATYSSYPNAAVNSPVLGGGNTTVSIDVSGNRVIRSPEFSGNVSLDYTRDVAGGELNLSTNVYAASRVYYTVDNRISQDPQALWNARAAWAPEGQNYKFSAWVKNITDETVINTIFISGGGDLVTYASPRAYGVGIEFRF